MIQYFILVVIFVVVVASLISVSSDRRNGGRQGPQTKLERLYHSKVHDAAFFDGENEDYAEAMAKLRQYGGS
jgi:hypothetical protein